MGSIPAQVAHITVAWLNDTLAAHGEVGRIESFEAERLGEGVGILGELARLSVSYEPGEHGPATIIAKCQSPAPENQFLAQMMGFYLREVNVYRQIADRFGDIGLRVPHAYHVDAGDDGLPFVLLLEDIAGAHCPDQIAGLTPHDARRIVDEVAKLHARFWDSPELDEMPWLPPMNNPLYKAGQGMALARFPGFAERFGDRIDAEMLADIERACHHYPEMLDHVAAQPNRTFTHTDCRAENYLFGGPAGTDTVTMVDFQLATRHFGPWDVANLLAGSMTPEVRRSCENDLVEHYHRRLGELGVAGYSLDQCWLDYRRSLLQSCTASVIVSDLQGGNERGVELLENLFLRPIIAATDHHVGDLLGEFC
jgi:aminoglycoside/choline kinase family phosphotransferase